MSKESEVWGALGKMVFHIHQSEHQQTRCHVAVWGLLILATNHWADYGFDHSVALFYALAAITAVRGWVIRHIAAIRVKESIEEAQKAAGG